MKRSSFLPVLAIIAVAGCLGAQKQPHAPDDDDLRYMYITVYPDDCTMTITVEFKDNTPIFRESRTTKIHEPISYSIRQSKVKRITVSVKKAGWVAQEKEWVGEVPFDVFIKLNTVP